MLQILLIDDNPANYEITTAALEMSSLNANVDYVSSGEQGLLYLERQGQYADRPRPTLILLDLNMPGMNGFDVLKRLKSDNRFATIPVLMLSSSDRPDDEEEAYRCNANCFITKQDDIDEFVHVLQAVATLWAHSK
jgi:two-component system response regulator